MQRHSFSYGGGMKAVTMTALWKLRHNNGAAATVTMCQCCGNSDAETDTATALRQWQRETGLWRLRCCSGTTETEVRQWH